MYAYVYVYIYISAGTDWTTLPNRLQPGPKLPSQAISDLTEAYLAKCPKSFDLSVPTRS